MDKSFLAKISLLAAVQLKVQNIDNHRNIDWGKKRFWAKNNWYPPHQNTT